MLVSLEPEDLRLVTSLFSSAWCLNNILSHQTHQNENKRGKNRNLTDFAQQMNLHTMLIVQIMSKK